MFVENCNLIYNDDCIVLEGNLLDIVLVLIDGRLTLKGIMYCIDFGSSIILERIAIEMILGAYLY